MSQHRWQIGFATAATAILLLAAGCPSTDFIATGNSVVSFEVVAVGSPDGFQGQPYDCIQWGFGNLRLRPLDGKCDVDSVNAGDPCLGTTDCDPLPGESGTCIGSEANELIGNGGIKVTAIDIPGNILGGDTCAPSIDAGGVCQGLFEIVSPGPPVQLGSQVRCFDASECGFCEQDIQGNEVPCDSDDDCEGVGNECALQAACVNPSGIVGAPLVLPQSLVLSAGLYEINELRVGRAMRYVNDPQPPLDPPGPFFRGCTSVNQVSDAFRDSLRFTVLPDQDKVIRFAVDTEALEDFTPAQTSCNAFLANITEILDCVTCEPAP